MHSVEIENVLNVYNNIANHFDKTRSGYIWAGIKNFINSLDTSSITADIGCGNGRNMLNKTGFIGCDFSIEFNLICSKKNLQSINANAVYLPFRSNCFDNAISIAVLHHIYSESDRITALNELIRIVKPGGKIYIQVWALNKSYCTKKTYTEQDNFIDWHCRNDNTIYKRFYHLFTNDELLNMIPDTVNVLEYFFEKDNWCIILQVK